MAGPPSARWQRLALPCAVLALLLSLLVAHRLDGAVFAWAWALPYPLRHRIGLVGFLLGSGFTLFALCGAMLGIGMLRANPPLQGAGRRCAIATAIASILVQILKHLFGRPRPYLLHHDVLFTGPTFHSGIDSFPSGHAASSFAFATVVANVFPALAWPSYGMATYVAVSRVVHGSHYASDVAVGALIGLAIGRLTVARTGQWTATLRDSSKDAALALAASVLFATAAFPEAWAWGTWVTLLAACAAASNAQTLGRQGS